MKVFVSIFVVVFALSSCSSVKQVQQQSASGQITSLSPELTKGKELFEQSCQKCHALPVPSAKSVEQWNTIMPVMAGKARLDDAAHIAIKNYILAMK
jgi:cytochrome c5